MSFSGQSSFTIKQSQFVTNDFIASRYLSGWQHFVFGVLSPMFILTYFILRVNIEKLNHKCWLICHLWINQWIY